MQKFEPGVFFEKAMAHYRHARTKHPYFANRIGPSGVSPHLVAASMLDIARDTLTREISVGNVDALTVLDCEVAEIRNAYSNCDYDGAIGERYDAIAVLMRMIDVMQGRPGSRQAEEGKA